MAARDTAVEATVAEWAQRGAQQQHGFLGMGQEDETLVLGHVHPRLMAGTERIIFWTFMS